MSVTFTFCSFSLNIPRSNPTLNQKCFTLPSWVQHDRRHRCIASQILILRVERPGELEHRLPHPRPKAKQVKVVHGNNPLRLVGWGQR